MHLAARMYIMHENTLIGRDSDSAVCLKTLFRENWFNFP